MAKLRGSLRTPSRRQERIIQRKDNLMVYPQYHLIIALLHDQQNLS